MSTFEYQPASRQTFRLFVVLFTCFQTFRFPFWCRTKNSMNIDLDQIIYTQRLVEISISSFCLLVTFYFTYRFHKLVIFNINFRIVLIVTHIVIAITAVLHPIIHLVPSHWYAVSDGRHFNAMVFYTITFIQNVNVYVVDLKLLIIGLERRFAFKNRQNAEKRTGVRILLWTFAVTASAVVVKNIIAFLVYRDLPLDDRLLLTFNFDIWAPAGFPAIVFAYASYVFGYYEFKRLNHYVIESYYQFDTLTESYEIKQVSNVLRVIWPLLLAYGVTVFLFTLLFCVLMYFHFVKFVPMGQGMTAICGTWIYSCFCLYNLLTILYMSWNFFPLRLAILNDIQRLSGWKVNSACVTPVQMREKNEQDEHFKQLHLSWDCANP